MNGKQVLDTLSAKRLFSVVKMNQKLCYKGLIFKNRCFYGALSGGWFGRAGGCLLQSYEDMDAGHDATLATSDRLDEWMLIMPKEPIRTKKNRYYCAGSTGSVQQGSIANGGLCG